MDESRSPIEAFNEQNPSVGAQFNKKMRPEDTDFVCDHLDEENLEIETSPEDLSRSPPL